MDVTQAYRHCARATRHAGSSFYYGMRLLPTQKRHAMYAIYAWSRICDDAVDDFEGEEAVLQLASAQSILQDAFDDGFAQSEHPVVVALGDAIRRFGLPKEPFEGLVEGMRLDMEGVNFRTAEDLDRYCDAVAGTVGTLSIHVFGYRDPMALCFARDMGRALQLTNILRDLQEDSSRGRVYLPEEDLGRYGYTVEDLLTRKRSPAFYQIMQEQALKAQRYYENAKNLFPLVDGDSLRCLRILYMMYYELLGKIRECGFDVFEERIRLSGSRKIRLLWGALWNASASV